MSAGKSNPLRRLVGTGDKPLAVGGGSGYAATSGILSQLADHGGMDHGASTEDKGDNVPGPEEEINPTSTTAVQLIGNGYEIQPDTTQRLELLSPAIDQAQTFAARWPELYRQEIFHVALNLALADITNVDLTQDYRSVMGAAPGAAVPRRLPTGDTQRPFVGGAGGAGLYRAPTGPLAPLEKLARALDVDVDAVERTVHIDDEGHVSILGRIEGRAKKELQTKYTLLYLYVKEMGLGIRMVEVDELRTLCIDQGCYDASNFTGNYKKDVSAGLIREDSAKGARARRYMLGQKGVAAGRTLLSEMVGL